MNLEKCSGRASVPTVRNRSGRASVPTVRNRSGRASVPTVSQRAYTLMEVMISMSITTILVGTIGSAVYVAGLAVPTRNNALNKTLQTSSALDQIIDELRYAEHIGSVSATSIDFLVPDRNSDGQPERISYSWSGVKGEPLWRALNGTTPREFVTSVDDFNLVLEELASALSYLGPGGEDLTETLVASFEDASSPDEHQVSNSDQLGQLIKPSFTADVVGWRFSGIDLFVKEAAFGGTSIDVYRANDANLPTGASLGTQSHTIFETSFSYGWLHDDFAGLPVLAPDEGVCLRLKPIITIGMYHKLHRSAGSGLLTYTPAVTVVPQTGGAVVSTMNVMPTMLGGWGGWGGWGGGDTQSSSGGGGSGSTGTWTHNNTGSILYRAYGYLTRSGAPQPYELRRYRSASLTLQQTDNPNGAIQANVLFVNTPRKLDAFWRADFHSNPALFDYNVDGMPDFTTGDSNSLTGLDTANGVWQPSQALVTNPNETFESTLTIVELEVRDTSTVDGGAWFSINADNQGTTAVPLSLFVEKRGATQQDVLLFNHEDVTIDLDLGAVTIGANVNELLGNTVDPLMAATIDSTDFLRIKLLIDDRSGQDFVAMYINGRYFDTHAYQSVTLPRDYRAAIIGGDPGAEFKNYRIRVLPQ